MIETRTRPSPGEHGHNRAVAVDRHVDQGEIAPIVCRLEMHADPPDMLAPQGALLADDTRLVPGEPFPANGAAGMRDAA